MVLASSPAGPIERVPNLKKRQTSKYWRPLKQADGSVIWQETLLLPSDPVNRAAYLAKGFRMNPPGEGDTQLDPEKEALYAEIAQLRKEREELKEKKAAKVATT